MRNLKKWGICMLLFGMIFAFSSHIAGEKVERQHSDASALTEVTHIWEVLPPLKKHTRFDGNRA